MSTFKALYLFFSSIPFTDLSLFHLEDRITAFYVLVDVSECVWFCFALFDVLSIGIGPFVSFNFTFKHLRLLSSVQIFKFKPSFS